jgi:ABC-2 type transport system permease protein
VSAFRVLRAKAEAVPGAIALIFGPFVAVLATRAPAAALVVCAGVVIAAGASTAIQYWFRFPAGRRMFRRRQTSSRVATYAEALSSTGWAGTGALAATGTWLAVVPGVIVLGVVAGAWMISPARNPSSV